MYSFTSSSRYKVTALFFGVLLAILAPQEFFLRRYSWTGGFLRVVDMQSKEGQDKLVDYHDLKILGSSRAQESIRPSIIRDLTNIKSVSNNAKHSNSTVDQVHFLTLYSVKRLPKYVIATVEPLHFATNLVVYDKQSSSQNNRECDHCDKDNVGLLSQIWRNCLSLLNRAQEINQYAQSNMASFTDNITHKYFLRSSDPANRVSLVKWGEFAYASYHSFLKEDYGLQFIEEPYSFIVLKRKMRAYTKVVDDDSGYEGHRLFFSRPGMTKESPFRQHISVYYSDIFPFLSDKYFSTFAEDLKTLRLGGVKCILLRLPIYKDLYAAEMKAWPSFDDEMRKVSIKSGVPYANLNNDDFRWLTEGMENYTDSSHMEHSVTGRFTESLLPLLKDTILE